MFRGELAESPILEVTFATKFNRTTPSLQMHLSISSMGRVKDLEMVLRWDGTKATVSEAAATDVHPSLNLAVATLTGISSGASHIIPRLLLPTLVSGRPCHEGKVHAEVAETVLGDDECLVIQVSNSYRTNWLYLQKAKRRLMRLETVYGAAAEAKMALEAKRQNLPSIPTAITSCVIEFAHEVYCGPASQRA